MTERPPAASARPTQRFIFLARPGLILRLRRAALNRGIPASAIVRRAVRRELERLEGEERER